MSLIIWSVNGAPDLLCDSQTVAETQTPPQTRAANQPGPWTEQWGADTLQLQLHLHCCSAHQCAHHHCCKWPTHTHILFHLKWHTSFLIISTFNFRLYSGPVLNSYPPHLYMSPSNNTGTSSGVRGRAEVRGRTRRSLSVDKERSMDSSLNRAIRAARHMKHTSRHMARSLATGLHYQELLSQSCSY